MLIIFLFAISLRAAAAELSSPTTPGICTDLSCPNYDVTSCGMFPLIGTNSFPVPFIFGGNGSDFSSVFAENFRDIRVDFRPAEDLSLRCYPGLSEFHCACVTVSIHDSNQTLHCLGPQLFGKMTPVMRIFDRVSGCMNAVPLPYNFTFLPPILQSVSPNSATVSTPAVIQIFGKNLGTDATLIHVLMKSEISDWKIVGTASSSPTYLPSPKEDQGSFFITLNTEDLTVSALKVCIGIFNNSKMLFGDCSNAIDFSIEDSDDSFPWLEYIVLPLLGAIILAIFIFYIAYKFRLRAKFKGSDLSMRLLDKWDAHWHIDCHDVEIGELVGQGSYAMVYKGKWNAVDVAVKLIKASNLTEKELQSFADECILLSRLHHPNIVQLFGASSNISGGNFSAAKKTDLVIVTEFLDKGSLHELIRLEDLPWHRKRLEMLLDACRGMVYLHQRPNPIIHRDLKTANILVDKNYRAKIADFGLSRVMNDDATMTACGTPKYCSPAVLNQSRYNTSADVWSFGVVLWEVFTRESPYKDIPPMQVAVRVAASGHFLPLEISQMPFSLKSLITDCLNYDDSRRPSFEEIGARIERMLEEGP